MSGFNSFTEADTQLGNLRVATVNDFFREENPNCPRLATVVAPQIMADRSPGSTFRIADVGCSKAMDTWSTAAALLVSGVSARIEAVDINPEVLAKATEPYQQTRADLELKIRRWGLPMECLDLFEPFGELHIQPVRELRDTVTFRQADIREQPLEPGFDAVIANNILPYYIDRDGVKPDLSRIVGNIAHGLKIGGLLTVGTYFPTFQPEFSEHGFTPALEWCEQAEAPNFFTRIPS